MRYMDRKGIDYLLAMEVGQTTNLHYHGILLFPTPLIRKHFQVWFNKSFGKLYVSDKGDADGWYRYSLKGYAEATPIVEPIPYLFDDKYCPTSSSLKSDYDLKTRSYHNSYTDYGQVQEDALKTWQEENKTLL